MINTNTPPRLYALTPIDQTEGLEDGEIYTVELDRHNSIRLMRVSGKWIDPFGDEFNQDTSYYYLRPLPEGTRVLKPGEVAENGNVAEWVKKSEGFILALEILATICDKAKLTEGSKKALEMVQWIKRLQSASQTNEAVEFANFIADKNFEYDWHPGRETLWSEVPDFHHGEDGPEEFTTAELYKKFITTKLAQMGK